MNATNEHFDEAYFQRGEERGTAYRDYARSADESLTFREVAQAIKFVFDPRRCLEIGCATGAIVRNLNELGVEAHGIDVSEWAVQNRLHSNVILAGAEDLPFDTDSFDFVYSSHALEHLPPELFERALAEIDRVAHPQGFQFHMLPIVGTFPYECDYDVARQILREDPTHNVLEPLDWWYEQWASFGWNRLPLIISFFHDTNGGELSAGQFSLYKLAPGEDQIARAQTWDSLVHRRQFQELEAGRQQMQRPKAITTGLDAFSGLHGPSADWVDFAEFFGGPISLEAATLNLLVDLRSESPRMLRVALIDDTNPLGRGVFEKWGEFSPGVSVIRVPVSEFRSIEGRPKLEHIDKMFFGGMIDGATFRVAGSIELADGRKVRLGGRDATPNPPSQANGETSPSN